MWLFLVANPKRLHGCVCNCNPIQFLTQWYGPLNLSPTLVFDETLKPKSPVSNLWVQNREYKKNSTTFNSEIDGNKYFYNLILRRLATHLFNNIYSSSPDSL